MIRFREIQEGGIEAAGYIPFWLNLADMRGAAEQIHDNYQHGGGWNRFEGFVFRPKDGSIKYPGDPRLFPVAVAQLRDETIYVYRYGWVGIEQRNHAFEIARID
jgi:hypothetical protein